MEVEYEYPHKHHVFKVIPSSVKQVFCIDKKRNASKFVIFSLMSIHLFINGYYYEKDRHLSLQQGIKC